MYGVYICTCVSMCVVVCSHTQFKTSVLLCVEIRWNDPYKVCSFHSDFNYQYHDFFVSETIKPLMKRGSPKSVWPPCCCFVLFCHSTIINARVRCFALCFDEAESKRGRRSVKFAFAADMSSLRLHHRSTSSRLLLSRTVIINKCCLMQRDVKARQYLWITPPHILRFDVTPNQMKLTARKCECWDKKKGGRGEEDAAEEAPGVTHQDLHFSIQDQVGFMVKENAQWGEQKWDKCTHRSHYWLGFYHLQLICVVFCHQNKDGVLLGVLFHVPLPELEGFFFIFSLFVASITPWMSHTHRAMRRPLYLLLLSFLLLLLFCFFCLLLLPFSLWHWSSGRFPNRSHHHPVHAPHGRGRHLRRSHRHYLARQAALLWLLPLPEEVLWQWLLPDAGAGQHGEDGIPESRNHPHSNYRGGIKSSACQNIKQPLGILS